MLRKTVAVVLGGLLAFVLVTRAHAHGQPLVAPGGDANVISPKLCFTVQIPGNWRPAENPGSYVSPDGSQYVTVTPLDAKDLKSYKGATLLEKESAALEKAHEKSLHQKLTGVTLAPFTSAVQGTWKWTAAPMQITKVQMIFTPRYFVDLSPEGIIVIEIENSPDDEALARSIFATLNVSKAQPCQLPKSMKELTKGLIDLPGEPKTLAVAPIEENAPPRSFKNPALPWSMQYPGNWQLSAADPRQVQIMRLGAGDEAGCSIFSVPVQFKALDEFADFWLRQGAEHMNSQGIRVRRTNRQRISLPNGIEGIDVLSEISTSGRSRTIFALVDGVGYVLDCETSVNRWESFAPVFAKIIGSFTLEKKQ